jgi:FlaA1/EpsC-like NDP-sugar epimerase
VSYWSAWQFRFGFYPGIDGIPLPFAEKWFLQGLYLIPLKLICLYLFGQFSGLLVFFRMPDAVRLFAASSLFTVMGLAVWVLTSHRFVPPGSVLLVDFVIFTFTIMGARMGIRLLNERRKGFIGKARHAQRIAIVGAGQAGSSLIAELHSNPELGMRPVALFDDSEQKFGRSLHGIPILGKPESIPDFYKTHDFEKVVLALPSASRERVREVALFLKRQRIPVETVPALEQLLDGSHLPVQTRDVRIEDLLYREPVKLDSERVRGQVQGRIVLVTGAGGSIGSELALQLAAFEPKELILLDRNEASLFLTQQQVLGQLDETELTVCVIDIRDSAEMERFFKNYQPEMVFHAAAHKHVGMMERQPSEAFLNNTMATLHLARQAIRSQVMAFCLISTDKAVEPSSVMGATKRLAEKAVQSLVDAGETGSTAFSMVRFGNVIGSSGSVIPIFEKQISERKPVTVTDPEMTRYFMTIPEAAGLVLQASTFGNGGNLFTLDMGRPVRIDDVARDLIRLHGLEPDVDIPVVYTGGREGEKLHEALHYADEILETTDHEKIRRVKIVIHSLESAHAFTERLEELEQTIRQADSAKARELIFNLLH